MNDSMTSAQRGTTLVVGAYGKTGRRVLARLTAAGMRARRASRSAETRIDWNDRSTWRPALTDVNAAYLTYAPDLAFPGAADTVGAFAELAVAQGVRRLILLSGRGEAGARNAEQRLQASGADWTILRCAFFNQNFSETFVDTIRAGTLSLPGGDTAEPFVDAEDIADVAFAALTDDRHIGQLYELTGPRLLTLHEVASELSEVLGRSVRYRPVKASGYAKELVALGLPGEEASALAELIAEVLDGRNAYVTDGVQRALGRAPRDFGEYVQHTLPSGIWAAREAAA
ncbi:MAG: NAD(P)H-binding protein [Thiohalocapsa sp.]